MLISPISIDSLITRLGEIFVMHVDASITRTYIFIRSCYLNSHRRSEATTYPPQWRKMSDTYEDSLSNTTAFLSINLGTRDTMRSYHAPKLPSAPSVSAPRMMKPRHFTVRFAVPRTPTATSTALRNEPRMESTRRKEWGLERRVSR